MPPWKSLQRVIWFHESDLAVSRTATARVEAARPRKVATVVVFILREVVVVWGDKGGVACVIVEVRVLESKTRGLDL